MSFTNPTGTRGARQPRGRIVEFFGRRMAGRLRRKGGGKAAGLDALVLTTIGAKSGQTRETVVARFPADGGGWLIVASANGAAHNPSWYHNIAVHPDQVVVDVEGRRVPVTAEELHGDERAVAWAQVVAAAPRFTGYTTKTDRELPIVRLREQGA